MPASSRGYFGFFIVFYAHTSANDFYQIEAHHNISSLRLLMMDKVMAGGLRSTTLTLLFIDFLDCEAVDLSEKRCPDLNTITSLIKSFLRQLPIPLITLEAYPELIEIASKS